MRNDVVSALGLALLESSLLRPETTLLAAVSGGADSVALLQGLMRIRQETGLAVCAVHVEHGLRGDSSRKDAAFVQRLCKELDVPLSLYHGELQGGMDAPGAEALAREARLGFFACAMDEQGADALLTAHHLDDQAETVLMRLLRGAGAGGLSAMKKQQAFGRGILLRPFLALPRETLVGFLREIGQPWREDESNQKPCCLRNRLRLEVFPLLEAVQPQAKAHMAQAATRLAWDEDCLGQLAEELLKAARVSWPSGCAVRVRTLLDAPKATQLRALRSWIMEGFPVLTDPSEERSLSHEDTLRLYGLLLAGERGSVNLPKGLRADRTEDYLHLSRQDRQPLFPWKSLPALRIATESAPITFGSFDFSLTRCEGEVPVADGKRAVLLTDSLLNSGLYLRTPAPEDRIHPFGAPGGKSLRRYLTDQKVDRAFREAWPVLADGNEVLWVVGIGASEKTRIASDQGQGLWQLTAKTSLPTPY